MDAIAFIASLIILIMSVVIHEISHGYTAELLGDPTPRLQGRLTLNPIKHMDLYGSVIIPLITSMLGMTFGWAKPVEWNPYNIKNRRVGEMLISIAGPGSNLFLALVFGLSIRFLQETLPHSMLSIFSYIVIINTVLCIFNLIPIPPLDGSKVLFNLLPYSMNRYRAILENNQIVTIFIVLFVLWPVFEPLIPFLFTLITGIKI
jgi:Zn-dependent protease